VIRDAAVPALGSAEADFGFWGGAPPEAKAEKLKAEIRFGR
jgi:hypothetical protein